MIKFSVRQGVRESAVLRSVTTLLMLLCVNVFGVKLTAVGVVLKFASELFDQE